MNQTHTCIKCGTVTKLDGMVAENSARPDAQVKMIRSQCPKCGFTEFWLNKQDFAQVMEPQKQPDETT
jgi:predicted nucleic-acid-binding Zn-ribbon protein